MGSHIAFRQIRQSSFFHGCQFRTPAIKFTRCILMSLWSFEPHLPQVHLRCQRSCARNLDVLAFESIDQRRVVVALHTLPRSEDSGQIICRIIRKDQTCPFFQMQVHVIHQVNRPCNPLSRRHHNVSATCLVAGFDSLGDCFRVYRLSIRFGAKLPDVEVLRRIYELMD